MTDLPKPPFMPEDFPPGTTWIEIRGVYDGWSVAELPDGRLVNRWPEDDRRHQATEEWMTGFRNQRDQP